MCGFGGVYQIDNIDGLNGCDVAAMLVQWGLIYYSLCVVWCAVTAREYRRLRSLINILYPATLHISLITDMITYPTTVTNM